MAQYYMPLVLTSDGAQHAPLEIGAFISPDCLPLSVQEGNLLKNITDGLYLPASDLLSAQDGNVLVAGLDGKLYVPPPSVSLSIQDYVLGAPDNQIQVIDGKLYVGLAAQDLNGIVSSMPDNLLKVIDNKLYVEAPVVDFPSPVSADTGNYIRGGRDNAAFLGGNDILSAAGDNSLKISTVDGKVYYKASLPSDFLSHEPDQLIGLDTYGKLYLTETLLDGAGGIKDAPSDGGVYARQTGVWVSLQTALKIDANDLVLSNSVAGFLATLALTYDAATMTVSLRGRGGSILSSIKLPDAQTITDVHVEVNPVGYPPGTYLVMTFSTSTGPQTIYVDLSSAIATVTSGNPGISVNNNAVSVVVDANSGLTVTGFGIGFASGYQAMTDAEKSKLAGIQAGAQVNVPYTAGNDGIQISGQVISARVDAGSGLTIKPGVGITPADGYSLISNEEKAKLDDLTPTSVFIVS